MLKKNCFKRTDAALTAFEALRHALMYAPVLELPDFTQEFVVGYDASGTGIGAVLQQSQHPIAFFSRKLADRHGKLPAYERELIGLAKAVQQTICGAPDPLFPRDEGPESSA